LREDEMRSVSRFIQVSDGRHVNLERVTYVKRHTHPNRCVHFNGDDHEVINQEDRDRIVRHLDPLDGER